MKLKEIYSYIDSIAPFSTQLDFDNAGFLIGDPQEELKKAVVTLDVTVGAIEYAKSIGANLIISHHPVIFDPIKSILSDSIPYQLLKSGISVISAHTNLDMAKGGINDLLCELLELDSVEPILSEGEVFAARKGKLSAPLSSDEFALYLKSIFPNAAIKYTQGSGEVHKVGVCSGSGGSLLEGMLNESVDAFITADVKHNVFLEAQHNGLAIYDCGHFDTEDIIISPLTQKLNQNLGEHFYAYHLDIIKSAELEN